ncbi:MAG TPA: cyclic pyranopterin monophosphate synthase MoaC [Fervidicoccus fontis]|jgi:cyclic pyranopterin phosphate synthase|uniref:Probable cyclic pyranopterin monophosphate synthase n=1 Tax=Fervidicoccus fontis TaxID=683846 RepID=A0A7C2UVE8_9CREN|nr:MAG: cyclic pyranopterin monophosphate synthase MoaC [Fervidicoccus sp.]HEU97244.1 cyclic pyranopterin monophosphate synthase MoaC [Fervidicoccus fontis]
MGIKMVDVGGKSDIYREATAYGRIRLKRETIALIREGKVEKGDVISASTIAAILAVKKTPEVLPLTHNIPITSVDVKFEIGDEHIEVYVTVRAHARTGVEMEALIGTSVALLNVWDMVKKYEKDERGQYPHTAIEEIKVLKKVKEGT